MTEYLVGALAGLIDLIPWLQLCLLPISHRLTFGWYSADRNTVAV